jgi:hypothetical protein
MKSFFWLCALSSLFFVAQAQAHTQPTHSDTVIGKVAPFVTITAISVNKEGQLVVQGQASEADTKVMVNFPDETTALIDANSAVSQDGLYAYKAVSKNFEPSGIIYSTPNNQNRLGQSASAYWSM